MTNRKPSNENPLYYLYTSGSTGKPKGLIHTTGGYLTHAATVHKHSFGVEDGDVYGCVADIGWTVGHSVAHYGSGSKLKVKRIACPVDKTVDFKIEPENKKSSKWRHITFVRITSEFS